MLLHDLEQGRLHLGGRAVDLVREQQVGEHGPEGRGEVTRALVVDARADEVGRHEVGRELDAVELPADDLGDGADRQRLRQAGHAFDEDVAAGEQGDDDALQQRFLADDDLLDLEQHLLERRRRLFDFGRLGLVTMCCSLSDAWC